MVAAPGSVDNGSPAEFSHPDDGGASNRPREARSSSSELQPASNSADNLRTTEKLLPCVSQRPPSPSDTSTNATPCSINRRAKRHPCPKLPRPYRSLKDDGSCVRSKTRPASLLISCNELLQDRVVCLDRSAAILIVQPRLVALQGRAGRTIAGRRLRQSVSDRRRPVRQRRLPSARAPSA